MLAQTRAAHDSEDAKFDHLLGLIYESALEPGLWQDMLDELARQLNVKTLPLLDVINPRQGTIHESIWKHLSPQQQSWLVRLMPHFERAVRLSGHHQAATQACEWAAMGQDAESLGVMVTSLAGQLWYSNRNGDALLKEGAIFQLCGGALACAHPDQQKSWSEAVDRVIHTGHPASLLLHPHARENERYGITLTTLPKQESPPSTDAVEGILYLVAALEHRRTATARQLMQLFGLSAAEAHLVRALASGETLARYAEANALKISTLKSQLRAAFAKTGTDRQAALVRLILSIPAIRESGA